MINKLIFLTKSSLLRKIKSKWFVVANIIIAALLIGVTNIDTIVKKFGGDFNEKTEIYIIDNTNETFDILKQNLETYTKALYDDDTYKIIKSKKTVEEIKEKIKNENKKYAIEVSPNDNIFDISIISNGYIETIEMQIFTQAINQTKQILAIEKSDISKEELEKIYSQVDIKRVVLDEEKNEEDEFADTLVSSIFPIIILPFFMLIIYLVQMIGTEINDEKTTRGMEIIISNVSPKTHFFSKIIAGNVFVILQAILIIVYGLIGVLLRTLLGASKITSFISETLGSNVTDILSANVFSKIGILLPIILVLMLLTLLAYSLLAGILASMTTNSEDFNQLQTPIMVISLAGYYLAIMASLFKGAVFIKILSYVPLISAILAPSLLVLGQIGIIDIIISILLTILLNYVLIKYGLKIYKVGILNYSSKDLWKKMFKALKEK